MAALLLNDKSYTLPDGGELTLGRDRGCGLVLADEKASAHHARVFHSDGEWWVEDLESQVGTKLNGRALITGPSALKEGDVIAIGDATLRFQLAEDPRASK